MREKEQTWRRVTRARPLPAFVIGLLALAFTLGVSACGGSDEPEQAEPQQGNGPAIPQTEVRFAYIPNVNNSIHFIAVEKGWFEEVGIDLVPEPYGRVSTDFAAFPNFLLNDEVDIDTLFVPSLIQSIGNIKNLKMILLTDTYVGYALLAHPDLGAKTLSDFMEEGLPFEEAIVETVEQVRDKVVFTSTEPTARPFLNVAFGFANMDLEGDTKLSTIGSEKMLQIANTGRTEFVAPTFAPQVIQLEKQGWIPIVTPLDLLENVEITTGPTSPEAVSISALVANPGLGATDEYIEENWDTILRWVSVYFRTLDFIVNNPIEAAEIQVAPLNAQGGTDLTVEDLQPIYFKLDPFAPWDFQQNFFEDESSVYYWRTTIGGRIHSLQEGGELPADEEFDPEQISVAHEVYFALKDLRTKSDELLEELESKTLSAEQEDLVTQAKEFYSEYNFLDASRYLEAANE